MLRKRRKGKEKTAKSKYSRTPSADSLTSLKIQLLELTFGNDRST